MHIAYYSICQKRLFCLCRVGELRTEVIKWSLVISLLYTTLLITKFHHKGKIPHITLYFCMLNSLYLIQPFVYLHNITTEMTHLAMDRVNASLIHSAHLSVAHLCQIASTCNIAFPFRWQYHLWYTNVFAVQFNEDNISLWGMHIIVLIGLLNFSHLLI